LALFRLARFPITDTAKEEEEEEEVVDDEEDEVDEDEDKEEEDEEGGCFSRDMGGWWGRSAMARHRAFTIVRRPAVPTSFSSRKLS
jgi:hypothetical protein